MKKFFAIITGLLLAAVAQAIEVPDGMTIETTVKQQVPVTGVEVTQLVCNLTNAVPSYTVRFDLLANNGRRIRREVSFSQPEAEAIMAGTGHSLTNVIDSARAAIQAIINQSFQPNP